MAYQTRNIIVGAAAVYLSVKDSTDATWAGGPAAPAGTVNTALAPSATDWRHVGFTTEGLEVSYEPDFAEVEVDQQLDSAKIFKQAMKVSLNTTLSEASLENLLVAWAQQANTYISSAVSADVTALNSAVNVGDEVLKIAAGSLGDEPVERALLAIGPSPRHATTSKKRERVYHARRVISVEASNHGLKRNEATVFPVSLRLLPDSTAPAGAEYGLIRDRQIEA